MEIRDPEFNRFFSEALKLLSTRRRFCGEFIFRGFVRVFLFSFLSFCFLSLSFLSLSFFQTDFSFASESQSSSRSLSQGDACNTVLIKVGALEAEQSSAQQQSSASDLDNSKKYPWLKPPVPHGFWNKKENQKAYMKWLGEKLGLSSPEDWYGLTQKMIGENSGSGLLTKKFRGSPVEMVMALVEQPEGGWKPWLFKGGVPDGFWDIEANQEKYMEWLGEKLGFSTPEDWYGLTQKMIGENSGGGLLQKFRGSPAEMVMALVEAPEGGWLPWLFGGSKIWDIEANQKEYMKWLGEKLGLSSPEDWYGLTKDVIRANSGSGLLNKFRGSPAEMVMTILADKAPKDGWVLWEFKGGVPKGFWDNEENQKEYMKWLGEELGYTKPEDWYAVTGDVIRENSGWGLLKKFRSSPAEMVMTILADKAPKDGWKKDKFNDPSKMERRMREILGQWFNGLYKPSFNDRKTHGREFEESGKGMEADVLFEDLKFAVEYHGEQHYEASDWFGGQKAFEEIKRRDQEKREAFKKEGYIYIEIPHFKWKDGSPQTLKELILSQLEGYQESSDPGVKQRASKIREALKNVDNTQNLLPFGESDSSGSENGPAESSTAASPNTASGGR